MAFSPLPASFLDFLEQCDDPGAWALDLGCGPQTAWAALAPAELRIACLDRRGPEQGTAATVVGDALRPPLLPARFELVVASNLYRHVLGVDVDADPLPRWKELVRPGGCLFLLEDEPGREIAAERNYDDLQRLLARLMPESRGSLIARDDFSREGQQEWRMGLERNRERPDADAVCGWLAAGDPQPGGEVDQLIGRIGRDGLSYGEYWWACWQRPAAKE